MLNPHVALNLAEMQEKALRVVVLEAEKKKTDEQVTPLWSCPYILTLHHNNVIITLMKRNSPYMKWNGM